MGMNNQAWQVVTGYLCLLALLVVSVAQGEVAQYLQDTAKYNKPYLIVYVNHSWMLLVLPMQYVIWFFRTRLRYKEQGLLPRVDSVDYGFTKYAAVSRYWNFTERIVLPLLGLSLIYVRFFAVRGLHRLSVTLDMH